MIFIVGIDDLESLFQTKWFCGSLFLCKASKASFIVDLSHYDILLT